MNFHSCFITEYGKKYAGPYAEHMIPAVYLYGLAIEKAPGDLPQAASSRVLQTVPHDGSAICNRFIATVKDFLCLPKK